MRSRSRTGGPSRRRAPVVEEMGARDLLSVLASHAANRTRETRAVHPAQGAAVTQAIPTPHERAREQFQARFRGQFFTGPGRFTDVALQTHVTAGGTSNQFLHGNVLIGINTPTDPTQPVTGTAELFDKNVSTTGTVLVLSLTGTAP